MAQIERTKGQSFNGSQTGAARLLPFLILAAGALLLGLWAGLQRLGWQVPGPAIPMSHGHLMVGGFLGTLISLERAAAIRHRWMYLAPAACGIGWITGMLLPGTAVGPFFITVGSILFCAILFYMVRREPKIHTITMGAGALAWLGGNLLWLSGRPVFQLVLWWAAFLTLTVAGERLELSRVLRTTRAQRSLFVLSAAMFGGGAALSTILPDAGTRAAGVGMLALSAWLARYDIARRNLRHPAPLTRFIAACLFTGYLWLAVSGLLHLVYGPQTAGLRYDASIHALLIGFIISMIFGHAPIIIPALTGMKVTYRSRMIVPLVFLHSSLILRIAGDLTTWEPGRRWGGMLNEVAVLLYFGLLFHTIFHSAAQSRAGEPVDPRMTREEGTVT